MCFGGSSGGTTTTTNNQTKVPGFIQDAQEAAIKAGSGYATSPLGMGTSPEELGAYGGIRSNAGYANSLQPNQAGLIEGLYAGGGLGQGMGDISDAYNQQWNVSQPYLQQNYLDPMSNPYLQPAIESARSSAYGDVADRF